MSLNSFKEVTETVIKKFSESELGKIADLRKYDKPISDYDKSLGIIDENKDTIRVQSSKEIIKVGREKEEIYSDEVKIKIKESDKLRIELLEPKVKYIEEMASEEKLSAKDIIEKKSFTDEEKQKMKDETGWSDEILDLIESVEEYELYKKAGLVEVEINGKKCLIRSDIDWEQKDLMGRTNKERAEQGLSPINKEGKVIELHHIGQKSDGPLAELTTDEHRGKGNDSILHDKTKESEIDRQAFSEERSEHWQSRKNESEDI